MIEPRMPMGWQPKWLQAVVALVLASAAAWAIGILIWSIWLLFVVGIR